MSTLAERQLAAWEGIAEGWPVYYVKDDARVMRCEACGHGIWLLSDETGAKYRYTHEQVLSLTVLHLRNFHPDLDPDKPAQTL